MHAIRPLILILLLTVPAQATCVWKEITQSGDDALEILIAPQAITVAGVACHCDGDCTAPLPQIAIFDRAGNSIALTSTLTCSIDNADSIWSNTNAGDPDRNLVEGEGLHWSVTNVPGSFDRVTVCVR